MAIIYKITNKLNGKVYIGQTRTPLNQRINKHFSKAKCNDNLTGIDAAIKKYGRENFEIEQIDECSVEQLDDLERFYIAKYNSYETGYNLTKGRQDGIGSKKEIDIDYAYKTYLEEKSIKRAAEILGCSDKTLSNIFNEAGKESNIFMKVKQKENLQKGAELAKKKVRIIELDKTFDSIIDCGRWLIDNGYTTAEEKYARNGVCRVLHGTRKSYLGMHYEFI